LLRNALLYDAIAFAVQNYAVRGPALPLLRL